MKPQPRKELMLDTALRLFNNHGYHNTGVDTIMKESGVSKTTLYKHFPSKEDLILDVLKRRAGDIGANLDSAIEVFKQMNPTAPNTQLIGVILEVMEQWIHSDDFHGCNFVNASAEYSNSNSPINKLAAKHKLNRKLRLHDILVADHPQEAKLLAEKVHLIIEGAIVDAHVSKNMNSIQQAKEIIELLLNETFSQ